MPSAGKWSRNGQVQSDASRCKTAVAAVCWHWVKRIGQEPNSAEGTPRSAVMPVHTVLHCCATLAKLPVNLARALDDWLSAVGLLDGDFPLSTEVRKVGRGKDAVYSVVASTGLSVDGIWHIIRHRATKAGVSSRITPHSTRVCFITLALKGGAPLHKVQYAAGHADLRTVAPASCCPRKTPDRPLPEPGRS